MVMPFIASISRDVFDAVPPVLKESRLRPRLHDLGGVPQRRAALHPRRRHRRLMLGLGRALGETMAVTFVIGNATGSPPRCSRRHDDRLDRQRVHRGGGGLYTSSLIALGLILFFIITFIVLAIARYCWRASSGTEAEEPR
jgi:phosphate transport system permease protein